MQAVQEIVKTAPVYEDYQVLLAETEPDLAIVCCENAFHSQVVSACLARGIHVVVEKPMATSMAGALQIAYAKKQGQASLAVNWPSTWMPGIRLAQQLLSQDVVGKVYRFNYKNRDSEGPFSYGEKLTEEEMASQWWYHAQAGGGAFWDYCCYGSCLASWFLDAPVRSAYGLRANFNSPFGDAEDYATITAKFATAVAQIEGSWTTVNSGVPNGPVIYGSAGTLVTDGDEVRIYTKRHTTEPSSIHQAEPLPVGRANIAEEFISHLENGTPLHPTLDLEVNLRAMMILDAGYRSSLSGQQEEAAGFHYANGHL
ncbi:MAG: Gfo/Idh/MocA family oxidoreductase [Syntrophomonadaceae bacterium]|nr:Gfo/Idh/MocA family oxidoreductase [Syntrophomonadaceae bacterium]